MSTYLRASSRQQWYIAHWNLSKGTRQKIFVAGAFCRHSFFRFRARPPEMENEQITMAALCLEVLSAHLNTRCIFCVKLFETLSSILWGRFDEARRCIPFLRLWNNRVHITWTCIFIQSFVFPSVFAEISSGVYCLRLWDHFKCILLANSLHFFLHCASTFKTHLVYFTQIWFLYPFLL